ncbi:MAG: hypothetical protein K2X93_18245 [Candidatus Obscuribacterales bacterium]|nr:hypothetical protein [Candidatus Obscuribacterales bacterium]
MTRKLFICGLLVASLVTGVGCEKKQEKPSPKDAFAKSMSNLEELKNEAAKQPNSRVVQGELKSAVNQAKRVDDQLKRGGHPYYAFEEIERLDKNLQDLKAALGYQKHSRDLREDINEGQVKVLAKDNPRAMFHIQQALLDLDLFDECAPAVCFIQMPEQHMSFVEKLLRNPKAEPLGLDSCTEERAAARMVQFRDQMFFEGNIEAHPGDSEIVKAHLVQAARYISNFRTIAKTDSSSEPINLAGLELERVWQLRRNIGSDKKLDKRVEVIERFAIVKRKVANRPFNQNLAVLVKDIDERCLTQSTKSLSENDFKELIYGVDRLEDAYLRTFNESR